MENTKRDLSLDFTKPRHIRGGASQPAPSLVTPILNLSTPELNKMISGEELAVLTPNGISSIIPQSNNVLPSPLIPTTVNNSNNIIANNSSPPPPNCNSLSLGNNNNNIINNNNGTTNHISNGNNNSNNSMQKRSDKQSKDMDNEKIEKKRERNRLAAKKCRQRKLETIDELRKTVSDWEQKFSRLEKEFEHFKALRNKEIEELTLENCELKNLMRQ